MGSEYTDAGKEARQQALNKIRQTDKQIAQIYERAVADITAKANAAKDGSLTQRWALDMQASLKSSIRRLNGELETTITDAAASAAQLPGDVAGDWLHSAYTSAGGKLSGQTFRDMFTQTNDDALRMVLSGRAYLDGKSLSGRIWTQTGRLENGINQVIQQGIAQKKSAVQIAKELEQYVNPDARETLKERRDKREGSLGEMLGRSPLPFPGNTEYNCLRLARTSINHEFFLSMKNSAKLNPFCDAVHWELSGQHFTRQVAPFGVDICDEYATHDEGLGVGNWPIDGVPLPHAQCLCNQWPEVPMSLDECAKRLRGWLDGNADAALDDSFSAWKDAMQSGLPDRRLKSIRDDAGEVRKGLLEKIAGRADVKALSVAERTQLDERLVDYSEERLRKIVDNGGDYVIMIPNEQNATVPDGKMDYVLRLDENKSRIFKAALGYQDGDQEVLKTRITELIKSGEYECYRGNLDQFGQRYRTYFTLEGKQGKTARVRAAWIVPSDSQGGLKLTTMFPDDREVK